MRLQPLKPGDPFDDAWRVTIVFAKPLFAMLLCNLAICATGTTMLFVPNDPGYCTLMGSWL